MCDCCRPQSVELKPQDKVDQESITVGVREEPRAQTETPCKKGCTCDCDCDCGK